MSEPSPAERMLNAFIKAANERKSKPLSEFVNKRWIPKLIKVPSDGARIAMMLESSIDIGFINPTSIQADGNIATMIFNDEISEEWLKCSLNITTNEPYFITSIDVTNIAPPEGYEVTQITEQNISDILEKFLNKLEKMGLFSGVAVISKEDKIIFQSCISFVDKQSKLQPNLDTKFNLGSINKFFTLIAIVKLVQDNKISFRDTVADLLPNFNLDRADKITVYHLLTHTSGLGDFFGPEFFNNMDKYVEIKDILQLIENQTLHFDPGNQFKYSNAGMEVLGRIIEKVSNMSYFDFVKEYIFKPANMDNTDSYFIDDPVPNLATGYTKMYPSKDNNEKEWKSNRSMSRKRGSAAGGGYSTANDLLYFIKALQNFQILNKNFTHLVLSMKLMKYDPLFNSENHDIFVDEDYKQSYGMNINGGAPGINSHLSMYPPYTIIVLSNYDPPSAMRVGNKIQRLLKTIDPDIFQKTKKKIEKRI
ncbi:MAG: serine hydrolase domain-containing protein [Candidatus Heimdallarchaeaceae archaeon]